jgi:hypothetical protein
MSELRKRDHISEENVGYFLDDYFYPYVKGIHSKITNIERIKDKDSQLKGIDVLIEMENGNLKLDEKVATNYTTGLKKFAFEINSVQGNSVTDGWLINKNETDFYLLGWIDVVNQLTEGIRIKNDEVIMKMIF